MTNLEMEQRFQNLEQENRRWRAFGLLGLTVLVVGILWMASGPASAEAGSAAGRLEVRELVIVDAKGTERAFIGTDKRGHSMLMMKGLGKEALVLGMQEKVGPYVELYDSKGVRRSMLVAGPDGSQLVFYDEQGTKRFRAGQLSTHKTVLLEFADELGKKQMMLAAPPSPGPFLMLEGANGKTWTAHP